MPGYGISAGAETQPLRRYARFARIEADPRTGEQQIQRLGMDLIHDQGLGVQYFQPRPCLAAYVLANGGDDGTSYSTAMRGVPLAGFIFEAPDSEASMLNFLSDPLLEDA